jgi:hypothetical protein
MSELELDPRTKEELVETAARYLKSIREIIRLSERQWGSDETTALDAIDKAIERYKLDCARILRTHRHVGRKEDVI